MNTPDTTTEAHANVRPGSAEDLPDYAPIPRPELGPALNEQGYYVGRVDHAPRPWHRLRDTWQAMSQEKVEIVRRLMALGELARKGGLISPPFDLVAPDMEIDLSRRVFNPETYSGFDGLLRLNGELREVWAEWEVIPERIVAVGDRVVSIETVRGRGRGSGLETDGLYASIWTFEDGRVTRIEIGLDPDEALKAVGLEE